MSAFEDFINLELPRRSAFLTVAITGYDGDPNDGGAPAILQGAPIGTWYLQETGGPIQWRRTTAPTTGWEAAVGAGTAIFATETALLAATEDDGTIAYAEDTDRFFFRKNNAWVARGEFVATDTVTAPGTGSNSEKWGVLAVAGGNDAVAFGYDAGAAGIGAVCVGKSARAGSTDSIAIGRSANSTGTEALAIGVRAQASTTDALALGADASATGPNASTALGANSDSGNVSVAVGNGAQATGQQCVALGQNASTGTQDASVAVGRNAVVQSAGSVGFGANALVTGTASVGGIAIGNIALVSASSPRAIALGKAATVSGADAIAIGDATTSALDGIAIGRNANVGHTSGVLVGADASTTGGQSVGVGAGCVANEFAIALGEDAQATHSRSGAIGQTSRSTAANRITFGRVGGSALQRRDVEVSGDLFLSNNADRGDQLLVKRNAQAAGSILGASVNVPAIPTGGALVLGVSIRVDVAVTGATGIDVGIAGDTQRYGANIPVALGSTSDFSDFVTDTPPSIFPSATNVVLTAVGGNFTGGDVTVFVHYMMLQAPTS